MKNLINKSFLSTVKEQLQKNFAEYLTSILPILSYDYNNQTLVITVLPENLIFVLKSLKLLDLNIFNLSSKALFHRRLKKFSEEPKLLVDLCHVISDFKKYSIS